MTIPVRTNSRLLGLGRNLCVAVLTLDCSSPDQSHVHSMQNLTGNQVETSILTNFQRLLSLWLLAWAQPPRYRISRGNCGEFHDVCSLTETGGDAALTKRAIGDMQRHNRKNEPLQREWGRIAAAEKNCERLWVSLTWQSWCEFSNSVTGFAKEGYTRIYQLCWIVFCTSWSNFCQGRQYIQTDQLVRRKLLVYKFYK